MPLGPPAVQSIAKRNIVVVAENDEGGFERDGAVYMVIPSSEYANLNGQTEEAYDFVLLSNSARSALAKPLLTENGELYLAQQASVLSAWLDERDLAYVAEGELTDMDTSWVEQFPRNDDDGDTRKLTCGCNQYVSLSLFSLWSPLDF